MAYIDVKNISKTYRIPHASAQGMSFRELVAGGAWRAWQKLQGKKVQESYETVQALDDVSFTLEQGDVLAIIGKNGSGKSTLLKILSKITAPTSGLIEMDGRVASLLEVGTGFHQELTGRENIYMNGVILGMSRKEVQKRFDEIVDFSGVERFLDTPVKRYSSGMLLRLAFSVAAHLEPEILIVDEVLAVGDYEFQKKCMKVMDNLGASGRTILFVSHNLGSLRRLCNKALLLSQGKVIEQGEVGDVISTYLARDNKGQSHIEFKSEVFAQKPLQIFSVSAKNTKGEVCSNFSIHESVNIEILYKQKAAIALSLVLFFYNDQGVCVFISNNTSSKDWQKCERELGWFRHMCKVPRNFLNNGDLSVSIGVIQDGSRFILREDNVISFRINDEMEFQGARGNFVRSWPTSSVRPVLDWKIERIEK